MKKTLCTVLLLSATTTAYSADRALIVGIGTYNKDENIPTLVNPGNDINESRRLAIEAYGFKANEIRILRDAQATRKNILDSIDNWLIKGSKPGDNIFFYYSGHGAQVGDLSGDEKTDGKDEVLVPSDAHFDGNQRLRNHILDDELNHRFKRMSNRNVVSIFDSCNSGTVTRGLRREKVPVRTFPTGADSTASQAYLDTLDEGTIINSPAFQQSRNEDPFINSDRQRTVWSAASSSQFAYVNPYDPKRQGGKFTQILFDGYVRKKADRNRNGIITNSEMYNYAAQESAKFCKRIFRDRNTCFSGLTPVLSISPEQRNMKFGFPKPIVAQQVNQTSTVSDTLPETNAGDISLYIETSKGRTTQIPFEELVWVTAQPKKSGYLYLLDHDSDGEVRFLFPMGTEDNYIDAGTPVKFPDPKVHGFQIRAFKKGKSELVAVLVDDPIDTTQLMREVRDNKTITAKQLGDFASKIAAIHVGDRTNRINKYSTKRLPYVVK